MFEWLKNLKRKFDAIHDWAVGGEHQLTYQRDRVRVFQRDLVSARQTIDSLDRELLETRNKLELSYLERNRLAEQLKEAVEEANIRVGKVVDERDRVINALREQRARDHKLRLETEERAEMWLRRLKHRRLDCEQLQDTLDRKADELASVRSALLLSEGRVSRLAELAAQRLAELDRLKKHGRRFCAWEDCDQEALYCEGHAGEYVMATLRATADEVEKVKEQSGACEQAS